MFLENNSRYAPFVCLITLLTPDIYYTNTVHLSCDCTKSLHTELVCFRLFPRMVTLVILNVMEAISNTGMGGTGAAELLAVGTLQPLDTINVSTRSEISCTSGICVSIRSTLCKMFSVRMWRCCKVWAIKIDNKL